MSLNDTAAAAGSLLEFAGNEPKQGTSQPEDARFQGEDAMDYLEGTYFEKLCKANSLTSDSIAKLTSNGLTSVTLLKLLRVEHIPRACEDWPLGQKLVLEALLTKLHSGDHQQADMPATGSHLTLPSTTETSNSAEQTQTGSWLANHQVTRGDPGTSLPSSRQTAPAVIYPGSGFQGLSAQPTRGWPIAGHNGQPFQQPASVGLPTTGHNGQPVQLQTGGLPFTGPNGQPLQPPTVGLPFTGHNGQPLLPPSVGLPFTALNGQPVHSSAGYGLPTAGQYHPGSEIPILHHLLGRQATDHRPSHVVGMIDDPTVHLNPQNNALSKGEKPLLVIDFASDLGGSRDQSEQVLSEQDGQSIVVKSGAKKLKLESISPAQWIGANARIMAELLRLGKLQYGQIPYYLGYTAKIGDLALRYSWLSVLHHDNEYRFLQAQYQFDWGRDAPHLATTRLRERQTANSLSSKPQSKKTPICKNYNTKGCSFSSCSYRHICSEPGCGKSHSQLNHSKEQ